MEQLTKQLEILVATLFNPAGITQLFVQNFILLLLQEIDVRQLARNERRQYCNPMALSYQMEVMPQQLRLNVSALTI